MLFHTVLFVLRSGLILLFKKEERENTQQEKKVHIDIDDYLKNQLLTRKYSVEEVRAKMRDKNNRFILFFKISYN